MRTVSVNSRDNLVYLEQSLVVDSSAIIERNGGDPSLDYIFRLILDRFSYVESGINYFPYVEHPGYYFNYFIVQRFPFENQEDNACSIVWNELVDRVEKDFSVRLNNIGQSSSFKDDLSKTVEKLYENFPGEDMDCLDLEKLFNLILFVYDYCMLTLRESLIHPDVDCFLLSEISIGGNKRIVSKRVAASIKHYLQSPYDYIEEYGGWPEEKAYLNLDLGSRTIPNPAGNDSNISAMFVDLMHSFFLSIGLKRRAGADWSKAEKTMLLELLRFFRFCNAESTTYVTTVYSEHRNYFDVCHLYSWIRDDTEPYSYLLCCKSDPLFTTINE